MEKIKKVLIGRIVSLLIAIIFLFSNIVYSSDGYCLRIPMGVDKGRAKEVVNVLSDNTIFDINGFLNRGHTVYQVDKDHRMLFRLRIGTTSVAPKFLRMYGTLAVESQQHQAFIIDVFDLSDDAGHDQFVGRADRIIVIDEHGIFTTESEHGLVVLTGNTKASDEELIRGYPILRRESLDSVDREHHSGEASLGKMMFALAPALWLRTSYRNVDLLYPDSKGYKGIGRALSILSDVVSCHIFKSTAFVFESTNDDFHIAIGAKILHSALRGEENAVMIRDFHDVQDMPLIHIVRQDSLTEDEQKLRAAEFLINAIYEPKKMSPARGHPLLPRGVPPYSFDIVRSTVISGIKGLVNAFIYFDSLTTFRASLESRYLSGRNFYEYERVLSDVIIKLVDKDLSVRSFKNEFHEEQIRFLDNDPIELPQRWTAYLFRTMPFLKGIDPSSPGASDDLYRRIEHSLEQPLIFSDLPEVSNEENQAHLLKQSRASL